MLRTRLWMGTLLVGLVVLLLLEDRWLGPWYPALFVCYIGASLLATREMLSLLPHGARPNEPLTLGIVCLTAGLNWWPAFQASRSLPPGLDVWHLIGACIVAGTISTFLREMLRFRGPDQITLRVALTVFVLVYLGLLPSFLAQIRWLPGIDTTAALALTVFVPKGNDIGAYFTGKFLTGRVLGRHHMTPLLSPKKTWQGAVGGMLVSVAVALGINAIWPVIPGGWLGAIGFGVTVGTAGVLGDLAESLLKRDLQIKDASAALPGFGGVLDVIDSLLFASPVAYVWFWWAARQAA
jgi:phosphatidate cytidylyltransferase